MGDLVIRRLGPDEWELLRRLRLDALQESPAAFLSTYEREVAFDEERWRSRLETSAYFVAATDGTEIGMVCAVRHAEPADDRPTMELVSMWVAPDHRRRGAGAQLVEKVLDYAREQGEPLVGLWVAGGNERAEALYRAAGFERTGEEQEMPGAPDGCEVRLTISLSPA
jgi:GNAT superfamily N-acetyltransferase